MVFITGDTHREFAHITAFCERFATSRDDILVILGDVGINYFGTYPDVEETSKLNDNYLKMSLCDLPLTLLCLHGNHEMRPETIGTYQETPWMGGIVYQEEEYPNLLFAKDGEIYDLEGKRSIAIGGAYSVDKEQRLLNNWGWWADEQPSAEIKQRVEERLAAEDWKIDIVFSHTCPFDYIGLVVPFTYADTDHSTEEWLATIERRLDYQRWYCGHFHLEKVLDKLRFMYNDIMELAI
jgi:3-oxoacid CoA-transferase subunit A